MDTTRRNMLLGFAGGAIAAAGTGLVYALLLDRPEASGIYVNFVGPHGYKGDYRPELSDKFKMVLWDTQKNEMTQIPVPFHVHSLTYCPKTRTFLGIQKWKHRMFSLDLDTKQVTKVLKHPRTRQFIGHGVLHPEQPDIYVSEGLFPLTSVGYAAGRIALRNIHTLDMRQEFSSHGENPHDIRLLRQGDALVVCNQGTINQNPQTRSNIAFLDRATGRLLKKLESPHLAHNFAHMDVLSEHEVIAVTKSRSGHTSNNNFIVRASIDGALDVFDNGRFANQTVEEILSVAVDRSRRVVAATNPKGKRVLFWDIDKKKLITALDGFDTPLGISLTQDGQHYIVSDLKRGPTVINASTLQRETRSLPEPIKEVGFTLAHSSMI